MAINLLPKGSVLFKNGDQIDKVFLIMKGSVKASFQGGSYVLKNQDVVGIIDTGLRESLLEYETLEPCSVIEYKINTNCLGDFFDDNKDIRRYIVLSLFKQLGKLFGNYQLLENEFKAFKGYIEGSYDDYINYCVRVVTPFGELPDFDEVVGQEFENAVPSWMLGYYDCLQKIILQNKAEEMDVDLLFGVLVKASEDTARILSSTSYINELKFRLYSLMMNESGIDLFEMYMSLYRKAVMAFDIDSSICIGIKRILDEMVEFSKDEIISHEVFRDDRINSYKKLVEELSAAKISKQNNNDPKKAEVMSKVKNALDYLLNYAGMDNDFSREFTSYVIKYKNLSNKNDSADSVRELNSNITAGFNELYLQVFLKAVLEKDIPVLPRMFLYFGFVDADLCGMDNAIYLYDLCSRLTDDSDNGVYFFFDWLRSIYENKKDPGRNEFEIDYGDYLHEQVRNKQISKDKEKELFRDPEQRVRYELDNVFSIVNKSTSGRIMNFCPLLSEHNIIKPLDRCIVTSGTVRSSLNSVLRVDFGAFYRQTVFSDPDNGITKEYIDVEVLPDVILMPNIGSRGVLWQEIEGKRRTTPCRMFMSIFQQEDIGNLLLRLTGQFRWEMCKRIQGAYWNDITEKSLTSEYFDYAQFYKKNKDLSVEAKEKIKMELIRAKNSYREMFIRDYVMWIRYECAGSPRLNKLVRRIMLEYVTPSKEVRELLMNNPMYREIIERNEIKRKAKAHRVENLAKKLVNNHKSVPIEIMEELDFLNR